jgi:hypothetical protein
MEKGPGRVKVYPVYPCPGAGKWGAVGKEENGFFTTGKGLFFLGYDLQKETPRTYLLVPVTAVTSP